MNEVITGKYAGTGAAVNVSLGWVPTCVIIVNATDGDLVGIGFPGAMADGTDILISGTAGPVLNAAGGISDYAGDGSHAPGFSVGADYSENAKTFRYIAFRGTAPADDANA